MRISQKIALFSSIWLMCILLCFDVIVVSLFIRTALRSETETLRTRAQNMIVELGPDQLMKPGRERQLSKYLPSNAMIRIISPIGTVISLMYNDPKSTIVSPRFSPVFERTWEKPNRIRLLTVREPIMRNGEPIGTAEFTERMDTMEGHFITLIMILGLTTVVAALISTAGGHQLSKIILKPIQKLIHSMKKVETNMTFEKIAAPGESKDELFELTVTFNRMIERIEETFQRQQRFVSDASHEFRTALTILEGYAGMLRRWGDRDEAIRKEAVETIYQETIRLKRMTRQLLHAAVTGEDEPVSVETIDVSGLCLKLSRSFRFIRKRSIRVEGADEPCVIESDPHKLKQLLIIFLDNAMKYSTDEITIRIEQAVEELNLMVEDRGKGIPEEELPHVFDRFYRVDHARSRKSGGTGLGLSIAKTIASQLRGSIHITSKEDIGTMVRLTIPTRFTKGDPA